MGYCIIKIKEQQNVKSLSLTRTDPLQKHFLSFRLSQNKFRLYITNKNSPLQSPMSYHLSKKENRLLKTSIFAICHISKLFRVKAVQPLKFSTLRGNKISFSTHHLFIYDCSLRLVLKWL